MITYTCQACGNPITGDDPDGLGVIYVPWSEAKSAGPSRWRVRHFACAALMGESVRYGYEIDIPEADTPKKLLLLTARLHGKEWFARSDWGVFVTTALGIASRAAAKG